MSGRILIADDLVTDRIVLNARLGAAHHAVTQVRTPGDLLRALSEGEAEAILMDVRFDGSGIDTCSALRAQSPSGGHPVILYGAQGDPALRLAAFRAGAAECLDNLPDESYLHALLRNLLRRRAARRELALRATQLAPPALSERARAFLPRPNVALVSEETTRFEGWRSHLSKELRTPVARLTPAQALTQERSKRDAYILCASPGAEPRTLRLLSELRARAASKHAILALQPASGAVDTAEFALDLGADIVLPARFAANEIAARLGHLVAEKRETDRLRRDLRTRLDEAHRDPLTGLFNRRYADRYLSDLLAEAGRGARPFALMVLDIDHFKSVNDRHGHPVGDEVLSRVAGRIADTLREVDLAARIGGEEFLVVVKDAGAGTAAEIAERLRRAVSGTPVCAAQGRVSLPITLSVGVSLSNGECSDPQALVAEADRALYASKAAGRNRVTFARSHDAA